MKDKKNSGSLFISVESRKGGVGKTTAALCVARLLKNQGYTVLFLDLDVTGTNAAGFSSSPFWQDDLHIIRDNGKNNLDGEEINLIDLFYYRFMSGKTIPDFTSQKSSKENIYIDLSKVNVLGSQIYKSGNKENSINNIELPGILFDSLHAFWLLEFVKQIIHNFENVALQNKLNKTVIILDNSPGYIGLAPMIHGWLTDIGPNYGKFLTVTSLDVQDLSACGLSVENLHGLYKMKWSVSRLLINMANKEDDFKVDKEQEEFFMRLLTTKNDSSVTYDPLNFYRDTGRSKNNEGGEIFLKDPLQYIAVIINRVPRSIKTGYLSYEFSRIFYQTGKIFTLLFGSHNKMQLSQEIMVSYDEYLENQFLLPFLHRGQKLSGHRIHRLIDFLEMVEKRLSSETRENIGDPKRLFDEEREYYSLLGSQLAKVNSIVVRARSAVENFGLGYLSRLIREEWLSGSIVPDFRSVLSRFFREIDFPYFELGPIELDYDQKDLHNRDFIQFFRKHIQMELHHLHVGELETSDRVTDIFMNSLLGLIGLSLIASFKHLPPLRDEMAGLFSAVIAVELKHWKKNKGEKTNKLSIQNFLAQESVTEEEIEKIIGEHRHFFFSHRMREEFLSFPDFYKACSTAQARLVDFIPDSIFLVQLLHFIVKEESENSRLFPFVKGIAEDVIINKTISHEDALIKMAKALRTVEYFKEFDGVLERVLIKWNILNE